MPIIGVNPHLVLATERPRQVRGAIPDDVLVYPRHDARADVPTHRGDRHRPRRSAIAAGLHRDRAGIAIGVGQAVADIDEFRSVGPLARCDIADHGRIARPGRQIAQQHRQQTPTEALDTRLMNISSRVVAVYRSEPDSAARIPS